ncbi:hypothetical protein NPX13_g382 [Xylaria arbuscula]|uniref:Xylanolytic transcriptional activator regulatory domain-containing protein n=1 Tax=Xylaria arbuscula TaxID=114810 RepID=A0A9W8TQK5_9PEZI|nr:hypothetical protein NPX13_g382 [Xylaria arbuscula]
MIVMIRSQVPDAGKQKHHWSLNGGSGKLGSDWLTPDLPQIVAQLKGHQLGRSPHPRILHTLVIPKTTTRRQLGLRSLDSSTTANALSSTFSCEAESAGKDVNQQAVDTLTISSSEGINQPNICHFGPTSNHALFRILSGIFIEYTAAKSNSWVSTIDNGNSTRTSSQVSPRPNINIAQDGKRREHDQRFQGAFARQPSPSPLEAEALIEQYITTIGITIPILDRADLIFLHETRSLSGRALLCIIFALVSGVSSDDTTANAFQRQSISTLLENGIFRGSTLESIQVLVLNCVFLQNNQRSVESWTYHAMAVKACYQLGLHMPMSYKEYGIHDRELRKRVWYSVVNEDRALSISLGRPFLIPTQYVRTEPLSSQISVGISNKVHVSPESDALLYFSLIAAIQKVKGYITDALYSSNIPSLEVDQGYAEILAEHFRLNLRLERWRDEISPFGKVLTAVDIKDWTESSYLEHRFQILLSIQFYSAKLLVNAPVLTGFLQSRRNQNSYSAEQRATLSSALAIIEADYVVSEDFRSLISCTSQMNYTNWAWSITEEPHRKIPEDIPNPAAGSELSPQNAIFDPMLSSQENFVSDGLFSEFLSQAAEEFLLDFGQADLTSDNACFQYAVSGAAVGPN